VYDKERETMKATHKKRAGALAVLVTLLGTAAFFLGSGAADANTFPCSETEGQDIWVNAAGTYAGVDPGGGNVGWVWVCVAPTGGEASQRWVVFTPLDPGPGGPGVAVRVGGCTGIVPGDPFPYGCTYLVEPTGVDTDPTTSIEPPTDGDGVTGAGVGTGACVYVNSTTPTACPLGGTLVGLAVAENDVQPVPGKTAVDPNASPQKLVTVTVGSTTVSEDVPISSHCIGIC
jgi:hypothetical protein